VSEARPVRVLVVDDHEVVRRGTRELLDRADGIDVVGEAQDGAEALAQARRLRPDVVLMDYSMPSVNGVEATRAIKSELPGTAVLALSAYDDEPYVVALLEAGAAGYLLKNVRGAQLIAAVRAVREGESVLDQAMEQTVLRRLAGRREAPSAPPAEHLTPREVEVLRLAARGLSNKEIARRLVISPKTAANHVEHIYAKIDASSRAAAGLFAMQHGLLA